MHPITNTTRDFFKSFINVIQYPKNNTNYMIFKNINFSQTTMVLPSGGITDSTFTHNFHIPSFSLTPSSPKPAPTLAETSHRTTPWAVSCGKKNTIPMSPSHFFGTCLVDHCLAYPKMTGVRHILMLEMILIQI